ncbi:hypothetical protein EDC94DRAFT_649851 [Helicostylum pulchrum]|nr:hypothetical protein EDC94DRAFT_649851 [Helicostylum pulchrum]
MRQKTDEDVKSNASVQDMQIDRPRTRAYIKQENEGTKESLKCALYSSVKIESPSIEISKYESSVKNKHCNICNSTFRLEKSFLSHELQFHNAKETPVIGLKTLRDTQFASTTSHRSRMADINNIHIRNTEPSPSKTSDTEDPNNYCVPCNVTFNRRSSYSKHLINIHHMSHLIPSLCNLKNMKPKIDILSLYCDVCKKIFVTKKCYIRHIVKFHEIPLPNVYSERSNFDSISLYCKVCDIRYKKKPAFVTHLRNIHHTTIPSCPGLIPNINDENNYCASCEKRFSNRPNYLHHLSSAHFDKVPELYQGVYCKSPSKRDLMFKKYCADCQKVFLLKRLHQIHMDKIHGIESLKYLPTAGDLDVNSTNNHCTLCDKTFSRNNLYRQHLIRDHNVLLPGRRLIMNNETPIVDYLKKYCNVCERVYKSFCSYRDHLTKYHRIKALLRVNINEIPVIDKIGNHCTACNKIYGKRQGYKMHLYLIHGIILPKTNHKELRTNRNIIPDMNDKKNHCASCNKTYSSKASYMRHLATIHDTKKLEIKQEDVDEKINI